MRIPDSVASQRVGDDFMILNVNTGGIFNLDEIGVCIWKLVIEGKSVEDLYDIFLETSEIFLETSEIKSDQLRLDIETLIGDLCSAGVLELEENRSDPT